MIAAGAAPEPGAQLSHRKADLRKIFARIVHPLHAIWTDRAHETLRDERFHDRSEEKRLHVHVEQARDPADRIVRVQGAKDEMTSHGRADCDICRFDVANFADHNDIRILA